MRFVVTSISQKIDNESCVWYASIVSSIKKEFIASVVYPTELSSEAPSAGKEESTPPHINIAMAIRPIGKALRSIANRCTLSC